jgi:hypothetical protein
MAFEITREDVWAGEIEDRPGGLARKFETIMRSGANLEFTIARRQPDKPGTSVVFLAPIRGGAQIEAALDAGLQKATGLHSLRVQGPDRPGLGAVITRTLADAGISVRGFSGAAIGDGCLFYLAFESDDDAVRAAQVLRPMLA